MDKNYDNNAKKNDRNEKDQNQTKKNDKVEFANDFDIDDKKNKTNK